MEENELNLEFSEYALDFLTKADKNLRNKILNKIYFLKENFHKILHQPLSYEYKEFFKYRVGKYRIIYTFATERNSINILLVEKRDKVYKILKRKFYKQK